MTTSQTLVKKFPYTPLQIAVHLYAWSGIALLTFDAFAGNLSANPIQDLERRTGTHALILLVLSLACTPMNTVFKWSEPLKRRRTLGLYAFLYVTIHLIIFMNLDYGLAWSLLIDEVVQKPRLIVGFLAFIMLVPLAMTSFDIWKQRMGKKWKKLHKLVYWIAPLAVLHYLMSKKADIFTLQGEVAKPLIYGLIVAFLLILRIPTVRKAFASFSPRRLFFSPKKDQQPEVDAP